MAHSAHRYRAHEAERDTALMLPAGDLAEAAKARKAFVLDDTVIFTGRPAVLHRGFHNGVPMGLRPTKGDEDAGFSGPFVSIIYPASSAERADSEARWARKREEDAGG